MLSFAFFVIKIVKKNRVEIVVVLEKCYIWRCKKKMLRDLKL